MKINFVLPFAQPGGGVRVVFEHTHGLLQKGHDVLIYYPGGQGATKKRMGRAERAARQVKYLAERSLLGKKEEFWFGTPLPVKRVPDLDPRYIRNADITIATANETADWVASYPNRCGAKAYFIQDYETWYRTQELVDETWKYPLAKITISQWLVDLGKNRFNQTIYGPIHNGLNHELFYPDPKLEDSEKPFDILFLYREAPQKGCDRGLALLRKLKGQHPEAAIHFFGRDSIPQKAKSLGDFTFDPPQQMIRTLYSKSRIFFLSSFQEGFAGPPLEAMACGSCVVSTRVGGPMDYISDGKNGLLADPEDEALLYKKLEQAYLDSRLRQELAAQGKKTARRHTWANATKELETTLQRIIKEHETTRTHS